MILKEEEINPAISSPLILLSTDDNGELNDSYLPRIVLLMHRWYLSSTELAEKLLCIYLFNCCVMFIVINQVLYLDSLSKASKLRWINKWSYLVSHPDVLRLYRCWMRHQDDGPNSWLNIWCLVWTWRCQKDVKWNRSCRLKAPNSSWTFRLLV